MVVVISRGYYDRQGTYKNMVSMIICILYVIVKNCNYSMRYFFLEALSPVVITFFYFSFLKHFLFKASTLRVHQFQFPVNTILPISMMNSPLYQIFSEYLLTRELLPYPSIITISQYSLFLFLNSILLYFILYLREFLYFSENSRCTI